MRMLVCNGGRAVAVPLEEKLDRSLDRWIGVGLALPHGDEHAHLEHLVLGVDEDPRSDPDRDNAALAVLQPGLAEQLALKIPIGARSRAPPPGEAEGTSGAP